MYQNRSPEKYNPITSGNSMRWLPRPRLESALRDHISRRFIGVFAAKGYGKTALIRHFLSDTEMPSLWYDLCDADVNMADTIRRMETEVTLQIERCPDKRLVLVIDNCQIGAAVDTFLDFLTQLFSRSPWPVTTILIGRERPHISFSLLKSQDQYFEIDASALTFTYLETEAFFNTFLSLSLNRHELELIYKKADGWAAGYLLISEYIMKRFQSDVSALGLNFIMEIPDLFEYISGEIFEMEPPEIQNFLLHTSLMTELRADIINEYLEIDNAEEMLSDLQNRHVFITRHETGLQYHHLFREFLYQKFASEDHAALMKNHLRLSRLYQKRFLYLPALAHAVACDDYLRGTELMNLIGDRYNPIQLLDLINGQMEEISPLIIPATTTLFLNRLIPEHILAEFLLPLQDAIDGAMSQENLQQVSNLQQRLASIQYHLGNIQEAAKLFEAAISNTLLLHDYASAAYNQQLLADCYLIMNRLDEARQCVRQALFFAEKYEIRIIQIHTLEVFSRLSLAFENVEQADSYISQALALAEETSYVRFWLFTVKALVLINQNKPNQALQWTKRAMEIVNFSITEYDRSYVYLITGQAYLAGGQPEQAAACFGFAYRHTNVCRWLRCETIRMQIRLCEIDGNRKKLQDKRTELLQWCRENRYDWILDNLEDDSLQADPPKAVPSSNAKSETCELKIQTLGSFLVTVHGKPVTIKRSASVRMLLYFIANRNRKIYRDEIIETILPGSQYHDTNYFNVILSSLRKTLEPGLAGGKNSRYIIRSEDQYQFNTSDIQLDAASFDTLAKQISSHKGATDISALLSLESLYQGDFMEEFPYESYLEEERERLQKRHLENLLAIARYYKDQNEMIKSIEYYDKILHKDPYLENIYEEYLRMLLASRSVYKARKVANRMIKRIEGELNIPCRKMLSSLFAEYQQKI